jgi:hypothetical protein
MSGLLSKASLLPVVQVLPQSRKERQLRLQNLEKQLDALLETLPSTMLRNSAMYACNGRGSSSMVQSGIFVFCLSLIDGGTLRISSYHIPILNLYSL